MLRRGVVNAVGDHGPAATAWWFLVVAPTTWSAGRLMQALEDGEPASAPLRAAGVVFAVTGALGAVVMPRSPFGLVAAAGLAALVAATSPTRERVPLPAVLRGAAERPLSGHDPSACQ